VSPITFAILIISLVAVTGLGIGSLRIRGISLGAAGVLFAGLLFGHFGAEIDPEIASFAKEFGLILFVFTIGLQLGPGIIQLWKQQGLALNAMAFAIVAQGFGLAIACLYWLDFSALTTAGLFSGATTNTPSLGAAQQAASMLQDPSTTSIEQLASAYAVAYPGGIVGIIASMLLIRRFFRINVRDETDHHGKQQLATREPIVRRSVLVDNIHLKSIPFGRIPGIEETGVRISRIKRAGETEVHGANEQTTVCEGDTILVVGPRSGLDRFIPLIGQESNANLMKTSGDVQFRRVYVTDPHALNRSLAELSLDRFYHISVTRIVRAGIEMTPRGSTRFFYGDIAHIVGDHDSLDRVTHFLGNSAKSMKETRFSPLFIGIAVGVVIGMIPFYFPGIPFPVRLGLAGGPLIAAIVLSLIGSLGPFVWYIPSSANLALRELGIILFLACAGLSAGESFFAAIMSLDGLRWMLAGLVITMVPLMTTGAYARLVLKENYLTICGLVAGSMTDPPALAFANSQSESDACTTAYAAVYPLTMILRIIAAQAIVLLFA